MSLLEQVLDGGQISGPHSALVKLRPRRFAVPIDDSNLASAVRLMAQECQMWGGANTPFVPASPDGSVGGSYAKILAGSAIDGMLGLDIFGLYHLPDARVSFPDNTDAWGRQMAAALLKYRSQDQYRPLEIVELADDNPWLAIYTACLGGLPAAPGTALLEYARLNPNLAFEDFVHVKRLSVEGSLDDLVGRMSNDDVMTPRQLSMVHLGYGSSGSTAIRDERQPLPEPDYARMDAGPNVVVICSPGNVHDIALLWNLRAAHGDHLVLPIGLPAEVASAQTISQLAMNPRIAHNGISRRLLYVTSASMGLDELKHLLTGVGEEVACADQERMLTLGAAAGQWREEVLVWHEGESSLIPVPDERHHEVLSLPGFGENTALAIDVSLPTPIPGRRGHPLGGHELDLRCGCGFSRCW